MESGPAGMQKITCFAALAALDGLYIEYDINIMVQAKSPLRLYPSRWQCLARFSHKRGCLCLFCSSVSIRALFMLSQKHPLSGTIQSFLAFTLILPALVFPNGMTHSSVQQAHSMLSQAFRFLLAKTCRILGRLVSEIHVSIAHLGMNGSSLQATLSREKVSFLVLPPQTGQHLVYGHPRFGELLLSIIFLTSSHMHTPCSYHGGIFYVVTTLVYDDRAANDSSRWDNARLYSPPILIYLLIVHRLSSHQRTHTTPTPGLILFTLPSRAMTPLPTGIVKETRISLGVTLGKSMR